MTTNFQAVYEGGIIRPLEPVDFPEQQQLSVYIAPVPDQRTDEEIALWQREKILKFLEEIQDIPDESPKDGLTNRDHDQIIYGNIR